LRYINFIPIAFSGKQKFGQYDKSLGHFHPHYHHLKNLTRHALVCFGGR